MRRGAAFLLLAGLAMLLAGCAGPTQVAADAQGVRMELEMSPRRPSALQRATLRLRLTDQGGVPVAVEALQAKALMPEMAHGATSIAFREVAQGVYEATHTFSMDGLWEVEIRGTTGGSPVRLVLPVAVGP